MCGVAIRFGPARAADGRAAAARARRRRGRRRRSAVAQRCSERVLVDDRAARAVDQVRGRLHRREERRVDEAARLVAQRDVQRDEVRRAGELEQRDGLGSRRAPRPGVAGRGRGPPDRAPRALARERLADRRRSRRFRACEPATRRIGSPRGERPVALADGAVVGEMPRASARIIASTCSATSSVQ